MAMRILSSLLCCFLFAGSVFAQSGKLKQAKQRMDNLDYIGAIELYNQILEGHDEAEAKINLAEAYRKINDTPNAEFWYGQVVRLPQAEPIHKLYYGVMLQRNGKCDVAKDWFQQYTDLAPNDQRGQYLLRACDYEDELMTRSSGIYEVNTCDFNSASDDFSPQFYKAGLVFSSERDTNPIIRRTTTWTGNPFIELYYVDARQVGNKEDACGKFTFGRPEKFSNEINTKFHDAAVAFSRNGEEIFFTRNNFLDGKKETDDAGVMRLKVFYARSAGEGKWGELQSLPFNSNEYSVAHPALSADGNKLFFTSDMPGGFGGMDLYFSEKESGRWGPPMNLGPEINTEGHEIFPTLGPDDKLYFASDGLIGLGGLDIYYTSKRDNNWTMPENMGFPINSISDDFGIIFNPEGVCGFLTSDRDGGAGRDDVYSFRKTALTVEVLVYDEKTTLPIEGALVYNDCKKDTMTTDAMGKIRFDMKLNDRCNLEASFADYEPNKAQVSTENLTLKDQVTVKIPLHKVAEFEVEGVVFDAGNSLMMHDATVTLTDETGKVVGAPFLTPPTGYYYFKLDRGHCYKIKATKDGYFAGIADSVCTEGKIVSEKFRENLYLTPTTVQPGDVAVIDVINRTDPSQPPTSGGGGTVSPPKLSEFQKKGTEHTYYDPETKLWIDKDTQLPADGKYPDGNKYKKGKLEGEMDRGVITQVPPDGENVPIPYLLHIYYDFDQAFIRDDAEAELQKLYTTLVEDPQYIIEVGSHTDARGSNHYNQRLSQRRAESVIRWLADKGIDAGRLVARGYGEAANVNDCSNDVPCNEKQHQMNRRTEFKVIGCRDCIDKKNAFLSKENPNVRVDECKTCPF